MDYVIIVAGGRGLRMGSELPKQFLPVGGKPVLMRTIERFRAYSEALQIIVVLPHDQQTLWTELCRAHAFDVKHTVVDGGETRFHSSRNGLLAIPTEVDGVVAIHDGVRPFVAIDVIARCFDAARRAGAAIPVLPSTDSLRVVDPDGSSKAVDRSRYRMVQTPQVFSLDVARKAFQQPYSPAFTDDASVVEAMGERVELVEGNRENVKITTPFDLLLAEKLIEQDS